MCECVAFQAFRTTVHLENSLPEVNDRAWKNLRGQGVKGKGCDIHQDYSFIILFLKNS